MYILPKIKFIIPFIMALTGSVCLAGTVAAPYQIGIWQGFRTAAISYTFDDSCSNQFSIAMPMFKAAGLKMTLFSVTGPSTGLFAGWTNLLNAYTNGNEIASHTVSHLDLSLMQPAQQYFELTNSQSAINANVTGQKCLTLAYPYCNPATESITSQYYIAARTCSGSIVSRTPGNFFGISSIVLGTQGALTPSSIKNFAGNAYNQGGWCVYLIHGIDSDGGWSELPSATLQTNVDYISANSNRFWVETFGNVVRYIKERDASSVAETANTGTSFTIQVTNNLDNSIYNYPITIRRPLPAGWPWAAVTQNNQPISTQVAASYIIFDVVPNGGDVVISESALPPVLSNPVLTPPGNLTIGLGGQTNVNYTIYSSTDLLNWLPIQTNMMASTYTNFTITASNSLQFYRAQWVP